MKCYSRKQAVVDELYARFKYRDVPKQVISDVIDTGLDSGFSLEQSVLGARLAISKEFHFHEYFTIQDVMTITGETEDEVKKRAEECKAELIREGKDPREYFPAITNAPGLLN